MKKLAWVQVLLGVLIVAGMVYVLFWSRTALIDKLEGPAFAGQSDASRWLPNHPSFLTFARWLMWPVAVFGLGVIVLGTLQVVRYPKGNLSHPSAIQVAAGFLVAIGALLVLLAVRPDEFVLVTTEGARLSGMINPMWDDPYAVTTFVVIILGLVAAGIGLLQHTLVNRTNEPPTVKAGWKNARSTARRRR